MGELASNTIDAHVAEASPIERDELLERRYETWLSSKSLWTAADLLSSIFVANRTDSFVDVASFVLEHGNQAPASLTSLAERFVNPIAAVKSLEESELDRKNRSNVKVLRARLREEPRNAIAWTDIARLYAAMGRWDRSARAIRTATALAPTNRFVLRSASRLYLHLKQPKEALYLLRRHTDITLSDPWLVAAEVGVASAADAPSQYAKKAFLMDENDSFSDFAKTEMRSALATLEMDNGKNRSAKQLFRKSMVSPNENTIAQVEWAVKGLGGIEIPDRFQSLPRSFEAKAYHAYNNDQWQTAFAEGIEWFRDESFSSRPAMFASYVASTILEDFGAAERVLRDALVANPNKPEVINNLAFVLINDGRLDEAEEELKAIDIQGIASVNELHAVTLMATCGLLSMRRGQLEKGRELYRDAFNMAVKLKSLKYRQLSRLYLAREEILANTDQAEKAMKQARQEAGENPDADIKIVLNRIEGLYDARIPKAHG